MFCAIVEPGEQRVALEHHAAVGARAFDRLAVEQHLPAVGKSSPATMRSSVDLPQPEGPRMVTKSFSRTSKSIGSSACVAWPRVPGEGARHAANGKLVQALITGCSRQTGGG